MDPPVTSFWAKLTPYGGEKVEAWHPLPAHAADVAACLERLLRLPVPRRRLARLGGLQDLTDPQIQRLGVFAAFHDIGKYNLGFQARCKPKPPVEAGHLRPILGLLNARTGEQWSALLEATDLPTLASWLPDRNRGVQFFAASICHHGEPLPLDQRHQPELWRPEDESGLRPFAGPRSSCCRGRYLRKAAR